MSSLRFRSVDRRLWVLFVGEMIIAMGFSMFLPYLTIYFNSELGVSMTVIGLVWLVVGVMSALAGIIGGEMADRWGRKRGLLTGMAMRIVTFALVAVAVQLGWGFLPITGLLAVAFLLGNVAHPAMNAMIADVTDPTQRMDAYSFVRVGANVGFAAGVFVGGFVAMVSYSALFVATSLAAAIYMVMVLVMVEETKRMTGSEHHQHLGKEALNVFKDRTFLVFGLATLLLVILMSQFFSTYTVFAKEDLGLLESEIGTLFAVNGIMIVLLQIPIARGLSRYRLSRVLLIGALLYTVAFALVGPSTGFLWMVGTIAIITVAEMIISPASVSFVSRLASEKNRGRYMGAMVLLTDSGAAMGPFVGGMIMDATRATPIVMWLLIASMGLISSIGFVLLGRRVSKDMDLV